MFFMRKPRGPAGLNCKDAVQKASTGDIHLIDVREQREIAMSGKAAGALHMPLMRLRDMADPQHPDFIECLREEKPIALYCASGARSHSALRILTQLGYSEVHNIGGLNGWVQAGGPIER